MGRGRVQNLKPWARGQSGNLLGRPPKVAPLTAYELLFRPIVAADVGKDLFEVICRVLDAVEESRQGSAGLRKLARAWQRMEIWQKLRRAAELVSLAVDLTRLRPR